MSNIVEKFFDFLSSHDSAPARVSDIIADDKWRYVQLYKDKPGRKRLAYSLLISGDNAVGRFENYDSGVKKGWSSRASRELSSEDRKAWAAKVAASKKAAEIAEKERRERAAVEASKIWDSAVAVGEHPYLARKRVSGRGLRMAGDALIVPLRDGNKKLWSVERIYPDGSKRYLEDGRKKGCYCSIPSAGVDTLLICEGYSTGASIAEATGLSVICAMDAGNLLPVANSIRHRYPSSVIVICCDNDGFKNCGAVEDAGNTGMMKGRAAAGAVGAGIAFPPASLTVKDFNDLAIEQGNDIVKSIILQAVSAVREGSGAIRDTSIPLEDLPAVAQPDGPSFESIPLEAYEAEFPTARDEVDWRRLLVITEEGKLKSTAQKNVTLFIEYHKNFEGVFALNQFHQNIIVKECPPWERSSSFRVHRLTDNDITQAMGELESFGLAPTQGAVVRAVQVVAERNSFHPAREYFSGLKWDGVERLGTWLSYYLGCEEDAAEYLSFVGTKWLVAAVKRIFVPGCKFDHVLVIEGGQGRGKSTLLKELATFGRDEQEVYHTDNVLITDLHNKDTIMVLQGSMIVELSELSGFSKKDDEEIKHWITKQYDDCRLPYARETTRFPRQFVLAATTNRYDYLKDATGNRRYWPVKSGSLDIEAIKRDREQIWAEAYRLYLDGLYIGPTIEEADLAVVEQKKRLNEDSWSDNVMRHARERFGPFKTVDIMADLGIVLRDRDDKANRRIASILSSHGYESKSIWNSSIHKTERFWVKAA